MRVCSYSFYLYIEVCVLIFNSFLLTTKLICFACFGRRRSGGWWVRRSHSHRDLTPFGSPSGKSAASLTKAHQGASIWPFHRAIAVESLQHVIWLNSKVLYNRLILNTIDKWHQVKTICRYGGASLVFNFLPFTKWDAGRVSTWANLAAPGVFKRFIDLFWFRQISWKSITIRFVQFVRALAGKCCHIGCNNHTQ